MTSEKVASTVDGSYSFHEL